MASTAWLTGEAESAQGEAQDLRQEAEAEDDTRDRGHDGGACEWRLARQVHGLGLVPWGMIGCTHTFSVTMETPVTALARRHHPRRRGLLVGGSLAFGVLVLAGCSEAEPTPADVPADILQVRPSISVEEASFVLAAKERGAFVTGATVEADIESATATCWALEQGGVSLGQIAVDDAGRPLGNEGDQLRTKQVMAAAVDTLCPDHASQVPQLKLPG